MEVETGGYPHRGGLRLPVPDDSYLPRQDGLNLPSPGDCPHPASYLREAGLRCSQGYLRDGSHLLADSAHAPNWDETPHPKATVSALAPMNLHTKNHRRDGKASSHPGSGALNWNFPSKGGNNWTGRNYQPKSENNLIHLPGNNPILRHAKNYLHRRPLFHHHLLHLRRRRDLWHPIRACSAPASQGSPAACRKMRVSSAYAYSPFVRLISMRPMPG